MKQSALLKVLPNDIGLRGNTPFLSQLDWEREGSDTQPRALRGLSRIIDGGLCHRCGSCVGICPTDTLGVDNEGYPRVKNLSACTDCDLCVKVCPGDEFDINEHALGMFGAPADLRDTHGHFIESFIGYGTEPELRERSTSGGVVTALLLHLIDSKKIDGAIVIASDKEVLWRGKPIVARNREEILSAVKSKYAISPTNSVFDEIRKIPGRYALVGLPCQIHGFVKAAALDARIKERVVLTIGLYCHAAVEHQAYEIIWDTVQEQTKNAVKFTSRIGKHPGAPHLHMKDGSLYPVYFGEKKGYKPSSMEIINILYRLYSPARCLTCFDASAEFADIAVGDPWMAPPDDDVDFYKGWSFALVRTERGKEVCDEAAASGRMVKKEVTRTEALACNKMMSTEKRWRAFRIIETHKRQGKPIPAYGPFGMGMPSQSGKQFLKTEVNMFTHFLCYVPKFRAPVLRFFLSDGGYYLLWLNSLRRTIRFFIRDSLAKLKRKLLGRV